MIDPVFELVAAVSIDGFLGRHSGESVLSWSSREEQERFRACLADHDWAFMGRITHEQVFRTDRWRVIFSSAATTPTWREPRHLWINPAQSNLAELIELMRTRHPVSHCLVLGATRVHDWFLQQDRIDRIQLAIEPIEFGVGIPLFSDQPGLAPLTYLEQRGFHATSQEILNNQGTTWNILDRQRASP